MIFKAEEFAPGQEKSHQVCVVGSGPAGITVALGLARRGIDVCMLEGGELESEGAYGESYRSLSSGNPPYLGASARSRYFGGSSNCWGGVCGSFDSQDLLPRPWIMNSGWPITISDLEKHYREAAEVLELDVGGYFWGLEDLGRPSANKQNLFQLKKQLLSAPVRFGRKFRAEIRAESRLSLYLGANVTALELDSGFKSVVSAACVTKGGKRFRVKARTFVLACGGIENARLLLSSDDQVKTGIGNEHGVVGKYFMDHLFFGAAAQIFLPHAERVPAIFSLTNYGIQNRRFAVWQTTAELQRTAALPNVAIHLDNDEPYSSYLPWGEEYPREGFCRNFTIFGEQSPNASNRVTLVPARDSIGLRRAHIHWQLAQSDYDAYARVIEYFVRFLGGYSRGRVRRNKELTALTFGGHHMGTTRMGADVKKSVVGPNLLVHGTANLFCAGSSVFPTGSCANPTFTIVALALRLRDHLAALI